MTYLRSRSSWALEPGTTLTHALQLQVKCLNFFFFLTFYVQQCVIAMLFPSRPQRVAGPHLSCRDAESVRGCSCDVGPCRSERGG